MRAVLSAATLAAPLLFGGGAVSADPLPSGSYSFTITSGPSTTPGAGPCSSAAADPDCAHVLTSLTVGATVYTTFTPPSAFSATGFPPGVNIQSRRNEIVGEFVIGDPGYDANMLANVFNDTDLNRYQQVDASASAGVFSFGYPVPLPTSADLFFLLTERNGNNTQFVEAFDTAGVSMGVVSVDAGTADYSDTNVRVHPTQDAFIAVIPLSEFADPGDPTRRIARFEVSNAVGAFDGGDHKAFVFGNPVPPDAVNDASLGNAAGSTVSLDVLANDRLDTGAAPLPGQVTVDLDPGTAGVQTSLAVAGEGTFTYAPATGFVSFVPAPGFTANPTPIPYVLTQTSSGLSDTATITITYVAPALTLVKAITSVADTNGSGLLGDAGDTVTYAFTVENTGATSLAGITVTDARLGLAGAAVTPADLAPGGTATLAGQTYVITAGDVTAGRIENTATATGRPVATVGGVPAPGTPLLDGAGNPLPDVSDVSDTGTEPAINGGTPVVIADPAATDSDGVAGNDGNEPTVLLLPGALDAVDDASLGNAAGSTVSLDILANDRLDTGLTPLPGQVTVDLDPGTAGVQTSLAVAGEGTFTYAPATGFVSFVSEPGFTGSPTPIPYVLTQISTGLSDTATITITYVASGLTLVKTTPEEVVRRGTLVPYTIRFRNGTTAAVGPISIVDTLPEGLVYVDGTAELDGVPVAVTVTGRTVTFPAVAVPANTEIVATLTARIRNGANPGAYVNTALALDPGSTIVAGPATATVRILPEAVFDCADVIGRVFEDLDGDGYQDPWTPDARPSTEEKLPVEAERNEVGLAGVRLVTLDGLVITTDANGLFSVPCAALPADRGSNFLLSLDTRTLPAGFEMTTETPRVMRLTPGMLTEMNFGARLARSIRVDLSAAAFPGGPAVGPELSQGIAAMIARLADEPMGVDLVFHVAADADLADVAAARAAMDAVEAEIARQWSEVARGRLGISQTIARAGE